MIQITNIKYTMNSTVYNIQGVSYGVSAFESIIEKKIAKLCGSSKYLYISPPE